MNETQTTLIVITAIAVSGGTFLLGWNLSVAKWRRGRRNLKIRVSDLEQQVQAFNEAAEKDPERGWMNTGAFYALNQVENTIKHIRDELVRRER